MIFGTKFLICLLNFVSFVHCQLGSDPVYKNAYSEKKFKNNENIHGKSISPAGKRQECLREIQTEIINQFKEFLEIDGHIGYLIPPAMATLAINYCGQAPIVCL